MATKISAQCNKKVLSLDLNIDRQSLIRTVCGSEFQTDGAENGKARLEKHVLMNGWTSSGMTDERKVRLADTFRDSVQVNRSGRQNCQLV